MGNKAVFLFFLFFNGFIVACFALQKSCDIIRKTDALFQKNHIRPLVYDAKVYHEV